MESVSMKKKHGMAKVLGSAIGFCGAMLFAFVKGPRINFMNNNNRFKDLIRSDDDVGSGLNIIVSGSQRQYLKGSLVMLLASFIWSSWLIMLVYFFLFSLFSKKGKKVFFYITYIYTFCLFS